jgi:predicted nucleic acid-binding protein
MTGLDTNVLLRYLLQDDPKQARQANQIIDRQLSEPNPGFVNLATVLEIVWVLRSLLKRSPSQSPLTLNIFSPQTPSKFRTNNRSSRRLSPSKAARANSRIP